MKMNKEMKMKNYTFTRDLNLGIVQISVKRGDIVTEKNGYFIYNNQKYDNTRDFQIALEKGWLVDSEKFVQVEELVQENSNNFGFKVQKEQENVVSISINQFKQNLLDQKNGFVEDGQQIKSLQQIGVHVVTANKETPQEAEIKPITATQSEVDTQLDKTVEKKKTTTKTQSKTAKKEEPKKSRIIKESEIGKQQVVGEARGMKIIKGE